MINTTQLTIKAANQKNCEITTIQEQKKIDFLNATIPQTVPYFVQKGIRMMEGNLNENYLDYLWTQIISAVESIKPQQTKTKEDKVMDILYSDLVKGINWVSIIKNYNMQKTNSDEKDRITKKKLYLSQLREAYNSYAVSSPSANCNTDFLNKIPMNHLNVFSLLDSLPLSETSLLLEPQQGTFYNTLNNSVQAKVQSLLKNLEIGGITRVNLEISILQVLLLWANPYSFSAAGSLDDIFRFKVTDIPVCKDDDIVCKQDTVEIGKIPLLNTIEEIVTTPKKTFEMSSLSEKFFDAISTFAKKMTDSSDNQNITKAIKDLYAFANEIKLNDKNKPVFLDMIRYFVNSIAVLIDEEKTNYAITSLKNNDQMATLLHQNFTLLLIHIMSRDPNSKIGDLIFKEIHKNSTPYNQLKFGERDWFINATKTLNLMSRTHRAFLNSLSCQVSSIINRAIVNAKNMQKMPNSANQLKSTLTYLVSFQEIMKTALNDQLQFSTAMNVLLKNPPYYSGYIGLLSPFDVFNPDNSEIISKKILSAVDINPTNLSLPLESPNQTNLSEQILSSYKLIAPKMLKAMNSISRALGYSKIFSSSINESSIEKDNLIKDFWNEVKDTGKKQKNSKMQVIDLEMLILFFGRKRENVIDFFKKITFINSDFRNVVESLFAGNQSINEKKIKLFEKDKNQFSPEFLNLINDENSSSINKICGKICSVFIMTLLGFVNETAKSKIKNQLEIILLSLNDVIELQNLDNLIGFLQKNRDQMYKQGLTPSSFDIKSQIFLYIYNKLANFLGEEIKQLMNTIGINEANIQYYVETFVGSLLKGISRHISEICSMDLMIQLSLDGVTYISNDFRSLLYQDTMPETIKKIGKSFLEKLLNTSDARKVNVKMLGICFLYTNLQNQSEIFFRNPKYTYFRKVNDEKPTYFTQGALLSYVGDKNIQQLDGHNFTVFIECEGVKILLSPLNMCALQLKRVALPDMSIIEDMSLKKEKNEVLSNGIALYNLLTCFPGQNPVRSQQQNISLELFLPNAQKLLIQEDYVHSNERQIQEQQNFAKFYNMEKCKTSEQCTNK